ncbi:helix-turn-helix domain-containing protein [uncultured Shimia sp.]|uniref:helix-turn-helix domain-containing protein n=1 Tax=uncultured Shimia sp. TaxID=573152 RepID=UPI002635D5E2|nr:helix-turn-helix domain-containing protein [uncultured Shimia sp.]
MKNSKAISTSWFPRYAFSAASPNLLDSIYSDFDQQSERLSGHDQSYTQLTAGAFQGRFLSGQLGPDVAIHIEYCNQSLEQEVVSPPDCFTFGVQLNSGQPFRINGHVTDATDMFVMSPGALMHVVSPQDGSALAISVQKDMLLAHCAFTPALTDWLIGLNGDLGFLPQSPLAQRMRDDCVQALENATQITQAAGLSTLGHALVASLAAQLALYWPSSASASHQDAVPSFVRFRQHSLNLSSTPLSLPADPSLVAGASASRRSLEQAFSTHVAMGPLTYLRVQRLHAVRRALAAPENATSTIGDIAAQFGFWDWSRFSSQFRRHFGILPSQARTEFGV